MNRIAATLLVFIFCTIAIASGETPLLPSVHHEIEVRLEPTRQTLRVTDHITLPAESGTELMFYLHAGLDPRVETSAGEARLEKIGDDGFNARYRLKLPASTRRFSLAYQGRLHHALESSAVEQSRGFRDSVGLIDERGSFLSAASLWYPQFEDFSYLTFDLEVDLPAGWRAVSQGRQLERAEVADGVRERWTEARPQQEIYLIAAQFTKYHETFGTDSRALEAQVFLRAPDQRLAAKYLDATASYLRMYEKLLGPYPYAKFALVENFWETGFGMPSFTLLGPKVIRLPFIINSSYPHEILHNWWGNGVYVDYATGNWSEGLTAYLADHLIKQQQGQAVAYRQQTLQKYRDYAAAGRDFALAEFRGRHSPATEAVGYGKTLMLFHMLRNEIGDDAFRNGLQRLYREYRFKTAAFSDLERVFAETAGRPLGKFFAQWVERAGAPELVLSQPRATSDETGFRLEFTLAQRQAGPPYALEVPIAITLDGATRALQQTVSMTARVQRYAIELPRRPIRLDVDPQFDLFRKLAPEETPAAFTRLFGARELVVVLPHSATNEMKSAWQTFARGLGNTGPSVEIVWDDQIETLPTERAVAVLGWANRFAGEMQDALALEGVEFADEQVKIGLTQTSRLGRAFAWITHSDDDARAGVPRAWITADLAAALPGLGRKLPHYHKYSYLAFSGDEPQNSLKGRWDISDSPLTAVLKADSPRASLESQAALLPGEDENYAQ